MYHRRHIFPITIPASLGRLWGILCPCNGRRKPGTHLGENVRQIEASDDQAMSFLSAKFKHEAADPVLDHGYSHIEASRSLGGGESAGQPAPAPTSNRAHLEASDVELELVRKQPGSYAYKQAMVE